MIKKKSLFFLFLTCFVLFVFFLPAHAQMITQVGYAFDDGTGVSPGAGGENNTQTAGSGAVDALLEIPGLYDFPRLSDDPDDPPGNGSAEAAANDAWVTAVGINGSSAAGGSNTWSLLAQTEMTEQVVLTTETNFNYSFQIFSGATLEALSYGGGPSSVSYDIQINLIDEVLNTTATLWESGATLANNSPYALTQRGTPLSVLSAPSGPFGLLSYVFGGYWGILPITMSNTFTLQILMSVNGTTTEFENGIRAFIGDPGDLDGMPGFQGTLTQISAPPGPLGAVPEPATLVLLGIGLLGMARLHRKS